MSALKLPWCTHTDPEFAHVAMYVNEAWQRRIPGRIRTIPMHDVDRAFGDGDGDGEKNGFVQPYATQGAAIRPAADGYLRMRLTPLIFKPA